MVYPVCTRRVAAAVSPSLKKVLIASWVVIAILLGSATIAVQNPQTIPIEGQNFSEYVLEFIQNST
ncbi:hypothetical protein OROGR_003721 [Orobanche gracilis]